MGVAGPKPFEEPFERSYASYSAPECPCGRVLIRSCIIDGRIPMAANSYSSRPKRFAFFFIRRFKNSTNTQKPMAA